MDQRNQEFIPFVLPVVKGTTVEFLNNDNSGHNVFSPDGEKYDLGTWPKGEMRSYTFEKTGTYAQLCKMHASMLAFIVVLESPYFAVTSKDGAFQIDNVPPGTYTLKIWHERGDAEPASVTVRAGEMATLELEMGRKKRR